MSLIKSSTESYALAIEIITIGLSFIAICFTAISIWLQRRHNRNAVKPIAYIAPIDYDGCVSVHIKNQGTGPLIIDSFKATIGHESKDDLYSWMPVLPIETGWSTYFQNLKGYSIIPGASLNLLEFKLETFDEKEKELRDLIRKELSRITITLSYKDIYMKNMPEAIKSLSWFGRHFNGNKPCPDGQTKA